MTDPDSGPNLTITPAEMVAIRDAVRLRMLHDYHRYRLTAQLYRNAGNPTRCQVELASSIELRAMIIALDAESERIRVTPPDPPPAEIAHHFNEDDGS